jgi:hypothetical protein
MKPHKWHKKLKCFIYVSNYLNGLEEVIASHLGHAVVGEHHVDGLLLLQNVTRPDF